MFARCPIALVVERGRGAARGSRARHLPAQRPRDISYSEAAHFLARRLGATKV
jgi:hypothetical protein